MNLLPYELFASVSHTLNISRTAEQYYLSQPAVSHHLKALEQSLGVTLIKRSKRGVTLTAEGSEYLPFIQEILTINEKADTRMRNLSRSMYGRITVATLSSASFQLSDSLVQFYAEHPDVQTDISLLDGAELIEVMRRAKYDFYFTVSPMIPDNPDYESLTIEHGRLSLFVNKRDLPSIDMRDWGTVRRLPFVSVPKSDVSLYGKVMNICRNRGFEPRIINIYNRAESVILSVNSGLGVAILPDSLGQLYQRPNVAALPIEGEDASADTVFVWDKSRDSAAAKAFRETVLSMYGGNDG